MKPYQSESIVLSILDAWNSGLALRAFSIRDFSPEIHQFLNKPVIVVLSEGLTKTFPACWLWLILRHATVRLRTVAPISERWASICLSLYGYAIKRVCGYLPQRYFLFLTRLKDTTSPRILWRCWTRWQARRHRSHLCTHRLTWTESHATGILGMTSDRAQTRDRQFDSSNGCSTVHLVG